MCGYFGGRVDAGAVAVAALYHDASEILTGDMPTPIKYYNPDIRDAYKQVEAIACRKLTGMLPQRLQDIYAGLLTPADPEVEELVKAADKLSAHIKCLEELKADDPTLQYTIPYSAREYISPVPYTHLTLPTSDPV